MPQSSSFSNAADITAIERRGESSCSPAPHLACKDMGAIGADESAVRQEQTGQHLVSFLIPVQNEALYVREALNSVLGQTWRNIEVIVIDDHSDDETYSIVDEMRRSDTRLQLHRSSGRGKVHAFNMAWNLSRGDIIALFAGDDILPESSVQRRVELLAQHGCQVASGKVRSFSTNPKYDGILYPRGDRPNLSGGAAAFTRQFATTVFPIPDELPNEDVWTRLHIECFSDMVVWTDEIVSHYRIHEANSMAFGAPFEVKARVVHVRCRAYLLFLEKYRHLLPRKSVAQIKAILEMDRMRKAGDFFGILLLPNLGIKQKLAGISYSNRFFYRIRVIFERYLAGA